MLTLTQVLLEFNDQSHRIDVGKRLSTEELYVDFNILRADKYQRISLTIHPKTDIVLQKVELQFKNIYLPGESIFCNGFQSWSESREYQLSEEIGRPNWLTRAYHQYSGDEHIDGIRRGKGHFHSWTYSYVRQQNQIRFIGSLLERTGFTLIEQEPGQQMIRVKKDCASLQLKHSYPTFDLLLMDGSEREVFDQYFALMECPKVSAPLLRGWASGSHYSRETSESMLINNLETFAKKQIPFSLFQIDDGYQTKVGDWLSVKASFPNGMQHIASKIKAQGLLSGIWLAPFVCEKKSAVFQNHFDWLIKDRNGKAIKVGYNAHWGGWYYALDFYQRGVQDYLTQVFYTVLNKWNFDLVKLDYLFAACIHPPTQKTRGQVMHEVLEFLKRLVGNRRILGCGLPLGSAFGKLDYCQVGADRALYREHPFLGFISGREQNSSIAALRSILSRWPLNGRVFHSDSGAFSLQEENTTLNSVQQYTLLLVKLLLGNLIVNTDSIENYQEEQLAELSELFYWKERQIQKVQHLGNDRYTIYFSTLENNFVAAINLNKEGVRLKLKENLEVELEAYESLVCGLAD